jgi:N-acetylmuramic acid 6-phosphate etherase
VVRFAVLIETGPEIIAGSTRMKADTPQKVARNLISSPIIVRLGRVYRGIIINMRTANLKLQRRAEEMVVDIAGCTPEMVAATSLVRAGGDLWTTIASPDEAAG